MVTWTGTPPGIHICVREPEALGGGSRQVLGLVNAHAAEEMGAARSAASAPCSLGPRTIQRGKYGDDTRPIPSRERPRATHVPEGFCPGASLVVVFILAFPPALCDSRLRSLRPPEQLGSHAAISPTEAVPQSGCPGMAGLLSAQEFIRALKGSADPPHVGGPLKIEIAKRTWDDASLYIPNKAEAIVEWLLSTMLKEKSKQQYVVFHLLPIVL